jgi:multidrug efflux pump subunit AcrA (membrane-fusion protein)
LRKAIIIGVVVVVAVIIVIAYQRSRTITLPDMRIVTVERGTITKAVVATG